MDPRARRRPAPGRQAHRSRAARVPIPRARAGPPGRRTHQGHRDLQERPYPRARPGRPEPRGARRAREPHPRVAVRPGLRAVRLRSRGLWMTEPVSEPGTLAPAITAVEPWSPPEGTPPVLELRG